MNQFFITTRKSKNCNSFPTLLNLLLKRIITIQFNSLQKVSSKCIRLYYVMEGKFEWVIRSANIIFFIQVTSLLLLPGQIFGGEKDFLDIGTISWLHIQLEQLEKSGEIVLGKWSSLSETKVGLLEKYYC